MACCGIVDDGDCVLLGGMASIWLLGELPEEGVAFDGSTVEGRVCCWKSGFVCCCCCCCGCSYFPLACDVEQLVSDLTVGLFGCCVDSMMSGDMSREDVATAVANWMPR